MQKYNKILFAVMLITLGVLFRTVWHLGPNIEFVTSSALLAGSYLGLGWSVSVPLIIMMFSDIILGNSNIFIFTWSGYLFIGCLGYLCHLSKLKLGERILRATGLGIIASLWFYIWTNFGVWLLDSWGMYPKTLTGLLQSYWYGLPFLKSNLLGNLFFVPLSFIIVEKCIKYIKIPGYWDIKKIKRLINFNNN